MARAVHDFPPGCGAHTYRRVSMANPFVNAVRDFPPGCGAYSDRYRMNLNREDEDDFNQDFAPPTPSIFEEIPLSIRPHFSVTCYPSQNYASVRSMTDTNHHSCHDKEVKIRRRRFKRTRRILAHTVFHRRMMIFVNLKRRRH
ncbi:hypothetical protein ACOSP7_026982 [Xanthoceras sorbifolium]